MAKVIIQRTNEFNNRLRGYGIYIDGNKVGTISNGQAEEYVVTPGTHTLIAKIDWCTSPEITFDVKEDDKKYFRVGGFKYGNWLMPLALIVIIMSYIVRRVYKIEWTFYLVIPVFLLLIYYITFGRKNYLTLKETESIF